MENFFASADRTSSRKIKLMCNATNNIWAKGGLEAYVWLFTVIMLWFVANVAHVAFFFKCILNFYNFWALSNSNKVQTTMETSHTGKSKESRRTYLYPNKGITRITSSTGYRKTRTHWKWRITIEFFSNFAWKVSLRTKEKIRRMENLLVEFHDICARHRFEININVEFMVNLTPKDDSPAYSRRLPALIHLKGINKCRVSLTP